MKRLAFLLLISVVALCGCRHYYVMRLSNGMQITTAGKPRLKGSSYYYKDAMGREVSISAGRVQMIEPASMVKEEKSPFIPQPSR